MLASNETDVRAAVQHAWNEVMPGTALDEALTWQEAGVDSLKSLHLLLSVETALARPISFDLLTRETRIRDLIAILSGKVQASQPARRRAYLVPGVYRIEAQLAELRAALRDDLAFEMLRDPELADPMEVSADMNRLGEFYADQIRKSTAGEPIILVGYSFGAYAALATALDLQAKGVPVDLLCLLDPLMGRVPAPRQPFGSWPRRIKAAFRHSPRTLMVKVLVRLGLVGAARRIALMPVTAPDFAGIFERRRQVLGRLGGMALRAWRPVTFQGRVLLITSDDFHRSGDPSRLLALLPRLQSVRVGGGHLDLLKGAPLQKVAEALRQIAASGRERS